MRNDDNERRLPQQPTNQHVIPNAQKRQDRPGKTAQSSRPRHYHQGQRAASRDPQR